MKYFGHIKLNKNIKIHFMSLFTIFNVATRQLKITDVAYIVLQLDSAALDSLSQCQQTMLYKYNSGHVSALLKTLQ